MFTIEPRDPEPLYAQLEREIRTAVATGRLAPGQQLPTVRQLAVDLRVNANTVARVYSTLERDGVVETHRGIGTFIRAPAAESSRVRRQLERELATRSARYIADVAALGFSAAEALTHLKRTYLQEKV